MLIECRVPEGVSRDRLRRRESGVSDAREDLYEAFSRGYERIRELPPDEHLIADMTKPIDAVLDVVALCPKSFLTVNVTV